MTEPPEYLSLSTVGGTVRPPFLIGRVAAQTLAVFWRNLIPFCGLATVISAPNLTISALNWKTLVHPVPFGRFFWANIVLSLVTSQLITSTLIYGVFEYLRGRRATWWECFRQGIRKAPGAAGTGIVVGTAIFVGYLFCLVPGLYFLIVYSVAVPVKVIEGKSILAAMTRSKELTVGRGWQILALHLLLGLLVGGSSGVAVAVLRGHPVAWVVWQLAFGVVGATISSTLSSVIYYRLRASEEDLDLAEITKVFD